MVGEIRIVANMKMKGQMFKDIIFCPGCFATLKDFSNVEYSVINGKEFD